MQTDVGRRVEPILARGDLVPDELTIELIRERLGRGDAARIRARRLPAHARAGRGARRDARRGRAPARCRLRAPGLGRRRARAPAQSRRAREPPGRHAEAMDRRLALYYELTLPISEHYRARGILVGIPGERTPEAVSRRSRTRGGPSEARASRHGDHPQERTRARADGRGRRGRRADARADARARAPRRDDGRARPDRGGVHPLRARRPDLQGLPRLPGGAVHLPQRHGRARDPRPRRAAPTATSSRSTSASRSAASSPIPPGRTPSARSRTRRSASSRRARPRSWPGSSRPASGTGSATSRRRCSSWSRCGVRGRSQPRRPRRGPRHARGAADPELRRARPRPAARGGHDARDRADDRRGGPGGRPPRGPVVDRDRGRVALGALRAHRGGHRRHRPRILPMAPARLLQ